MIQTPKPLAMSRDFLAMVRGTCELHQLLAAGRDDSPEADAIRDATDGPWAALSEVERDRVRTLSEDLYSLVEPSPAMQPMTPEAQSNLIAAMDARHRGEWDRALDLLRQGRASIDPALLSYLRGSIWLEAGDPTTAALFLRHAQTLRRDNEHFRAKFLEAMSHSDASSATESGREVGVACGP